MARKDIPDIVGGLVLLATGLVVLAMSYGYGIGTVSEMGAGFFPMALGATVAALGLAIAVPALARPGVVPVPAWRPVLGITVSIAAFAVAIEHLGLLPAVALATVVAAASDRESTLLVTAALAAFLAAAGWLIFIKGLGLPIAAYRLPL